MALHQVGVNTAVTLGGEANGSPWPADRPWTPSFAGATELTIAFTIKPDEPYTSYLNGAHLCQLTNGGQTVFAIRGYGDGHLVWTTLTPDGNDGVHATTAGSVMRADRINRLVFRYRATGNTFTIMNNGVDAPVTLTGFGGNPPATIATIGSVGMQLSANCPLELGGASALDEDCVNGIYQQWAIWSRYLADAEAVDYGTYGDPARIASTSGKHWVTLAVGSVSPIDPVGMYGPSAQIGHLIDGWSGFHYGQELVNYDYGSGPFLQPHTGAFFVFTEVPDLPSLVTEPESQVLSTNPWRLVGGAWVQVPPTPEVVGAWTVNPNLMRAQRGFDGWEMTGELGRRGATLAVPGSYTLQQAISAAQYGDDIVISGTVSVGNGLSIPNNKTVDASTLRVPPDGRTPLTVATPITMS